MKRWQERRRKARWAQAVMQDVSLSYGYTIRDANRARRLAIQFSDVTALNMLNIHGPLASHCENWEVLAWPCPSALSVLVRYICSRDGQDRPCHVHDWVGDDE